MTGTTASVISPLDRRQRLLPMLLVLICSGLTSAACTRKSQKNGVIVSAGAATNSHAITRKEETTHRRSQQVLPLTWRGLGVEDCDEAKWRAENTLTMHTCSSCQIINDVVRLECVDHARICNPEGTVCVNYAYSFEWMREHSSNHPSQFHNITYTLGPRTGQSLLMDNLVKRINGSMLQEESCIAKLDENDGSSPRLCSSCQPSPCNSLFGLNNPRWGKVDCDNLVRGRIDFATGNLCTPGSFIPIDTNTLLAGWVLVAQEYERRAVRMTPKTLLEKCEQFTFPSVENRVSCSCNLTQAASTVPSQFPEVGLRTCASEKCIYCDAFGNYCALKAEGAIYMNDTTIIFEEFQYVQDREDIVRVESEGTSCKAFVNGEQCQSCEVASCEGSTSLVDPYTIDCDNIVSGEKYSTCGIKSGELPPAVPNLFSVFDRVNSSYTECRDRRLDAVYGCRRSESSQTEFNEFSARPVECSCTEIPDGYRLNCTEPSCELCRVDDNGICGTESYGFDFLNYAQQRSRFNKFRYTRGRSEIVFIESSEDYDVCNATLDGQKCDTCLNQGCSRSGFASIIDCSNVVGEDGGSWLDACAGSYPGGVFDREVSTFECSAAASATVTLRMAVMILTVWRALSF